MDEDSKGRTLFLNLILIVILAVSASGQQDDPSAAYFVFDYPPHASTFIIKVTDPQTIQQARDILATGSRKIVTGTIIKQPVYYNPPWSYHLDPKSISFRESAAEVCDATMQYIEENLDTAFPDWCPYGSRLLREIPPPTKPVNGNLPPRVSMTYPHADNTYSSVSPASITLIANADDPDGSIGKVSFSSGNVIGETATYPYRFTWYPLAAGTYTVSATAIDNNGASTTSRSVTFVVNGGPPRLLSDGDTSKAAALESITFLKEPFGVISEHSFSPDQRTRLLLFGVNLELRLDENVSAITVQAEDSQQRTYLLPVEAVSTVPKFPWLMQVTVKLPDELQGLGNLWLSVFLRGIQSNKVAIQVK
jgi:hypothetical protein